MQQVEKSSVSSTRIVSRAVLRLLFMVDSIAVSHSDAVKNKQNTSKAPQALHLPSESSGTGRNPVWIPDR